MPLLVVLFIVVPIVELAVIIEVGSRIGVWETIALLVGVSVVGAWLAKHEGFAVVRRFREQLEAGRIPSNEIIDGILVLAGGLLLLTPGFLTDGVGILLLLPPTRAAVRGVVRRRLRLDIVYRYRPGGAGSRRTDDDVIDL